MKARNRRFTTIYNAKGFYQRELNQETGRYLAFKGRTGAECSRLLDM
jgi:hypothetical protein